MTWNLVDAVGPGTSPTASEGPRRSFYVPIAAVSPGLVDKARTVEVAPARFECADLESIPSDNHALQITVRPTENGFAMDGALPDPAVRLHALAEGFLRFRPVAGGVPDSLELELLIFQFPTVLLKHAPWWERWLEAGCIPRTFVYENVDRTSVQSLVEALVPLPNADPRAKPRSRHGLSLPVDVTPATRAAFVNAFMAGVDTMAFLRAAPGAFLGAIANEPGAIGANPPRRVTFRVRYHDDTPTAPRAMNPRELFYLIFGNDSTEAATHPVLRRLDDRAVFSNQVPESCRMWLRPPLRTSARVDWEAKLEIDRHGQAWGKRTEAGQGIALLPERLYNRLPQFFRGPYGSVNEPSWKCNVFTLDVCVRSGFRVRVFRQAPPPLVYYCRPTDGIGPRIRGFETYGTGQFALFEAGAPGSTRAWARMWTQRFLSLGTSAERVAALNEMISREGRTFILNLSRGTNPGHMVIVQECRDKVDFFRYAHDWRLGLVNIRAHVFSAGEFAARSVETNLVASHNPPAPGHELFLVELHPGRDPDTVLGLADLNVF